MMFISRQIVIFLMLSSFYSLSLMAKTEEFADMDVELGHDDLSLYLQGDLAFNFSKPALEALANGLPLAVNAEFQIKPVGQWYWQKSLMTRTYKLEIQYHALSQQYLVKGINSPYPKSFLTQSTALAALGRIEKFPLIELSSLRPREHYEVSIRSTLDSNSLPVPLRPLIYLSDEWRLISEWKHLRWPAQP